MKRTILLLGLLAGTTLMSPAPNHEPNGEVRSLLQAREAVWRACFANDRQALQQSLPPDLVAINPGEQEWQDLQGTLQWSHKFASEGGKLVRLSFPKTVVRRYGEVFVLHSHYVFETEQQGKRTLTSGRATEIFIRKNGRWLNPSWHLDSGR